MCSPLVSIVCDVYNHEPYLRRCLDGLIMQKTTFPVEILIHDDASTDGSVAIIQEFENRYPGVFKPIYQIENQFSKGVRVWHDIQFPRSKGKYIALCEGDDYWIDPYKLQKQVDYLEADDNCVLTFHNAIIDSDGERVLFKKLNVPERIESLQELLRRWAIPTASVMFRKESLLSYYESPFFPNEDYALELLMNSCGSLHYDPACMSVYRLHPGSLSEKMAHSMDRTYSDLIRLLDYCKLLYPEEERYFFEDRIAEYKKQMNKEILLKKYPFLCYLSWRYYKRLIFGLLRIRRVAQ